MHAAYWGFRDDTGLCPLSHRYVMLTPTMAELEAATPRGTRSLPRLRTDGGGSTSSTRRTRDGSARSRADPWPLVAALQEGPQTFVHGDWKLGNLGRDGARTILLDWDRPGEAPAARRPRLVPGGQLRPAAGVQGGHHRRVPGQPSSPRASRHRSWWDDQLAAGTGRRVPAARPGPRPRTRPSSAGGAIVSPHGIPDRRFRATPIRARRSHGLAARLCCTTGWRRSRSPASRAQLRGSQGGRRRRRNRSAVPRAEDGWCNPRSPSTRRATC